LGCALVAGKNPVPKPAAGMTAFLTIVSSPSSKIDNPLVVTSRLVAIVPDDESHHYN
jgi:hypothetical protein